MSSLKIFCTICLELQVLVNFDSLSLWFVRRRESNQFCGKYLINVTEYGHSTCAFRSVWRCLGMGKLRILKKRLCEKFLLKLLLFFATYRLHFTFSLPSNTFVGDS